jgi:pimeloyl-ACP methyl ester carboxylesterase
MLFAERIGSSGSLIVALHWLGGSSRTWRATSQGLAQRGFTYVALDLPGFGQESTESNATVSEVVQRVIDTIHKLREGRRDEPWALAGHSMGGKLAMIIARMSADGHESLSDLAGILLVSPSPPGPEPMSDSKRTTLAKSLGPAEVDKDQRIEHAGNFIDDNTGRLPLLPAVKQEAVSTLMQMNPAALMAWLTDGSKEDWSSMVGQLPTPAIVFAGSEDEALGPDAQREHTLPYLANASLVALRGGGHLAPLERPAELADRMADFCQQIGLLCSPKVAALEPAIADLIASDQTSHRTREVLMRRLSEPGCSGVLSAEELRTLRALVERVIPEAGFDLATRVDRVLAEKLHDGWRFDHLPPDAQAWKQGLLSLDLAAVREYDVPFVALDPARQDELLTRAQKGELGKGALGAMHIGSNKSAFDADQMSHWFEDVRGDLAKLFISDPRAMQRIGFAGFADENGFTHIRLGDRQEVSS